LAKGVDVNNTSNVVDVPDQGVCPKFLQIAKIVTEHLTDLPLLFVESPPMDDSFQLGLLNLEVLVSGDTVTLGVLAVEFGTEARGRNTLSCSSKDIPILKTRLKLVHLTAQ
jgi:hypothetical protein